MVFIDTLKRKHDFIALADTWLKDNVQLDDYNLADYQKTVSDPRKNAKRQSGAVDSYIRDNLQYKKQDSNTEIECLISQVKYDEKGLQNFCFIY